ncbi:MAG TPA: beta-galactosidase trimerization domain-containing protein, partial [Spirochaetota bacterium]|nr:beta-galactosidase trimerization domain-containing protein [Spirochaetota bacterium]
LDWCRFTVRQQLACALNEINIIKKYTPHIPVTTNSHMTFSNTTDWSRFAEHLDVMSMDPYPSYRAREDYDLPLYQRYSFEYDFFRSQKAGRPFMRMEGKASESAGSRQKRPGIIILSAIQAIAHGSDSVQFFQWRNGRGGLEKFHGAMIEHEGSERLRGFREITRLGQLLRRLAPVAATCTEADTAICWDKENYWLLELSTNARGKEKGYLAQALAHYHALQRQGVSIDVISPGADLSKYKLLIIPMQHLLSAAFAGKLKQFVAGGGTLVTTFNTGYTNENGLVHTGGFPGLLRQLCGIWCEELDALDPGEKNSFTMSKNNCLNIKGKYKARCFCDYIHKETATVLARFNRDYYRSCPALTVNNYGQGQVYHIGTSPEKKFYHHFYSRLKKKLDLKKAPVQKLPRGTGAGLRCDNSLCYLLLYSFKNNKSKIKLTRNDGTDLLDNRKTGSKIILPRYGFRIIRFPV